MSRITLGRAADERESKTITSAHCIVGLILRCNRRVRGGGAFSAGLVMTWSLRVTDWIAGHEWGGRC